MIRVRSKCTFVSYSLTKFRIDNPKSLYFNHSIKADKKRKLKLKISNAPLRARK